MNVDDCVAMLAGMRAGAPPEVFIGVMALAASVLAPADHATLAARLGAWAPGRLGAWAMDLDVGSSPRQATRKEGERGSTPPR